MKLVLASKNAHKLVEMRDILSQLGVEVVLESEVGVDVDVEETGATFEENAFLKARAVREASGLPAIADDSGLCVDALNGGPGVYSARYGGEELDDRGRYTLLLQNMRGQTTRAAHFACAIACADEFIDRFPDGYETVLEQNAANLSGGQKQRLRIARAIVKQPKILILDDSTSAVDMATDEHIRRALKTAMPGSTKIIIAQRIASILSCDRIIVLHEGELSDVGTHAELMERSQIYRDVYDSQMREEGEQHGQS